LLGVYRLSPPGTADGACARVPSSDPPAGIEGLRGTARARWPPGIYRSSPPGPIDGVCTRDPSAGAVAPRGTARDPWDQPSLADESRELRLAGQAPAESRELRLAGLAPAASGTLVREGAAPTREAPASRFVYTGDGERRPVPATRMGADARGTA
jgi:hypothetical protein